MEIVYANSTKCLTFNLPRSSGKSSVMGLAQVVPLAKLTSDRKSPGIASLE